MNYSIMEDTVIASDPASETLIGSEPQSETLTTSDSSETLENATETPQTSIDPDALQKQIANLESALRRANKEAKDHRLKANELTKFKDEIEAAKLSESEKLQKQLAALQAPT